MEEERKRLCSFPFASPKLTNKIKKETKQKSYVVELKGSFVSCHAALQDPSFFLLLQFSWSRGAARSWCRWKALAKYYRFTYTQPRA